MTAMGFSVKAKSGDTELDGRTLSEFLEASARRFPVGIGGAASPTSALSPTIDATCFAAVQV